MLYYDPMCGYSARWELLTKKKEFSKTAFFQAYIHGHESGCLLYSRPSFAKILAPLYPKIGLQWTLSQAPPEEALDRPFGIFDTSKSLSNPFEVARFGSGWIISKTLTPRRYGQNVPVKKIEDALESIDFIDCACLYTPRDPIDSNSCLLIVLAFVSPMSDLSSTSPQIEIAMQKIQTEVGKNFTPNKIAFFPVFPKSNGQKVDRNWCIDQYRQGLLQKKMPLPEYRSLYKLRWQLMQEVQTCQNS